jgi:hypothetical protein
VMYHWVAKQEFKISNISSCQPQNSGKPRIFSLDLPQNWRSETSLGSLGGDVDTADEGGDRSPTAGAGAPAAGDETTPLPPGEGSCKDAPELVLTQVLSSEEGETYAPVVATIVTGQDGWWAIIFIIFSEFMKVFG